MSELPKGWVTKKLSEIASKGLISDGDWVESKDQDPTGAIRLIQLADIGDGIFKDKSSRFMNEEKAALLKCTFLQAGDVLIARMPDPLGRACIFPDLGYDCVTVVDICLVRLTPDDLMDNRLLKYWLNSPAIRSLVDMQATGTTRRRITKKKLAAFELPVPPRKEQKRIADKLDSVLAKVEAAQARLDKIPAIQKRFRQSVLAAATSGELTKDWRNGAISITPIQELLDRIQEERTALKSRKLLKKSFGNSEPVSPIITQTPDSWVWCNFDEIALNKNNALKAGPFGSALKKQDCVESGYKVYGQEQVISGDEHLDTYFIDSNKFNELISCEVGPGDILISLVGTIGKVLVLSDSAKRGIINPRLVKLSLNPSISSEFIKLYLNSPHAITFFKSFSHGGTMDILNLKILRKLPICLPPVEEQSAVVSKVSELFQYAKVIEDQHEQAVIRISKLTQSILAKAFKGELLSSSVDSELESIESSVEVLNA